MYTPKNLNLLLFLCFMLIAGPILQAQAPKVRQNIEDLYKDTEAFNKYVNAIKTLKEKDWPNEDSYKYWANVHNTAIPAGNCAHHVVIFLPWHRSYFYWFEKELQKIDPDVTIPYWDFTVTPTDGGMKFPIAFEDPSSPLYPSEKTYNGRPVRPIDKNPVPPLISPARVQKSLDKATFFEFWNDFEGGIHDGMHPWCGNPLFNPGTAAEDPLFWSFHAYIDLVWDKWQKCHNYKYSGDPDEYLFAEGGGFHEDDQAKGFFNIEEQLGYTYNNTCEVKEQIMVLAKISKKDPMVGKMASFAKNAVFHPEIQSFDVKQAKVQATHVYPLKLPEDGFWKAELNIKKITQLGSHTIKGTVFVHERDQVDKPELDKSGSSNTFFLWKGHMHEGDHKDHSGHALLIVDYDLDITDALHNAIHLNPGKEMAISIILEAVPHFDGDNIPSGDDIKFEGVGVSYQIK